MKERCDNTEAEVAYNEAEAQREESFSDLDIQVCERCRFQWPATEINQEGVHQGVCLTCLDHEEKG